MKGAQVLFGEVAGREAAALLHDGVLEDLIVDSDAPRPGAIYRARAARLVKGQGGLFLETPDGSAFLRGTKGVAPGDLLMVQVTGYSEPGKATPVTSRLLFKSRYAIVTPDAPGMNISRSIRDEETRLTIRAAAETELAEASPYGVILRSACAAADPDAISQDVDDMLRLASAILQDEGDVPEKLLEGPGPQEIAWRDWPVVRPDAHSMEDVIEQVRDICVDLPNSASLSIEPTRALVAIDVNTGGDTSPAAGLKANLSAARALPRLLRVRGLGGQIVVDFAPMPKKDRKNLESALRTAFRTDDVETALVGWTPMGHFELNRKRARAPLYEISR